MNFNGTLLVTIITFIIFVFLMNKILYAPILSIMKKRQDFINDNLTNTKDNEQKAQMLIDQKEETIKKTKQNGAKILKDAIFEAQKESNLQLQQAKDLANKEVKSNENKLQEECIEAKNQILPQINSLVQKIVSKILKENVEIHLTQDEIKKYLNITGNKQ